MNRVLTVPNFSTPVLPDDLGLPEDVMLHYARGDIDHGRSVVAFSGAPGRVLAGLFTIGAKVLGTIDLRVQTGAHPRVGALDVVPFIDLEGGEALRVAESFAKYFELATGVPVLRYERSSPIGETLPGLRRNPGSGHPKWGTTVVGARAFLIAANLDFPAALRNEVRHAAREMRRRRDAGDAALLGVRALAFDLPSRDEVQLSFNLTRPDETGFDTVVAIGETLVGAVASRTELIGVIRRKDLAGSTRLRIDPAQIVD